MRRYEAEAYQFYLQSDHWKEVRRDALMRADHRCQLCNSETDLEVHHRTYARLGWEDEGDLIALCRDCHRRHHELGSEEELKSRLSRLELAVEDLKQWLTKLA
jgi:5-methylcytosine-specific restriction endonuclease McrA